MHTDYRIAAFRQLRDEQVRCLPRERKVDGANRAESLLNEVSPQRVYTYEYLHFRLTDARPTTCPRLRLSGKEASHELRLLVEDLSDAADVPAEEAGQRVLTMEELAQELHVSVKTICRWRRHGLVSRRFLFEGRKRIGFLRSSVDHFLATNGERVVRGARFSQLTPEERRAIISTAQRLARAGDRRPEIIRDLARQHSRSAETIRYTLKQFDRRHPDQAIFPQRRGRPDPEVMRTVYQCYRRGEPVERLADQFSLTVRTVVRSVNEMRARRIMDLPLDYMPNPAFDRVTRKQETNILGPAPAGASALSRNRAPSGLPSYLASLYDVPLLTQEQEVHLFRKMNYLKCLASRLRSRLNPARPRRRLMDRIERLYDESVATKNEIIRANLRLVVSIAKRYLGLKENLFELISDGNMSLIRAVEKFDFARNNKFSTYASWAIMKNFARSIPDEFLYRKRFHTSQDEMFIATEDVRSDEYEQESAQSRREAQVERILGRLDQREQEIVIRRFGLNRDQEPLTLQQVGVLLGVTKERVRQLEARALLKLKRAVREESLECVEC